MWIVITVTMASGATPFAGVLTIRAVQHRVDRVSQRRWQRFTNEVR